MKLRLYWRSFDRIITNLEAPFDTPYRKQKIWNGAIKAVAKAFTVELATVLFLFPLHEMPEPKAFIWSCTSEEPDKRFSTK